MMGDDFSFINSSSLSMNNYSAGYFQVNNMWGRGEGELPHIPHRGLYSQVPDAFGLNPLSKLVIGYYRLTVLNEFRKNLESPRKLI